jgi:hypothetical protein
MLQQAGEAAGNLRVPFVLVVPAGLGVEFVGEVAIAETRPEAAIWF